MRRLNVHSLRKSINNLCEFLDKEYKVNLGGCCLIASIIAKYLEKLGIGYELVIFDMIEKDENLIQKEILNKRKNGSYLTSVTGYHTCSHYCINILGAGTVNEGDYNDCKEYIIKNVPSKNIKWIYDYGNWNKEYDTSNTSTIKNIFKNFFKKYEDVHEVSKIIRKYLNNERKIQKKT